MILVTFRYYYCLLNFLCLFFELIRQYFLCSCTFRLCICTNLTARFVFSGVNLFAAIYTRGNVDAFVSLAKYVVTTCWHGCTCFCLSYDAILHQRALLQNCHESDCLEADFTFSPAITLLSEATKPHLDFTADYVGGCEVVLEKNISL